MEHTKIIKGQYEDIKKLFHMWYVRYYENLGDNKMKLVVREIDNKKPVFKTVKWLYKYFK